MAAPIKMTTSNILDGQISLIDIEGFSRPVVRLNDGKYSGVKYQYGDVTFEEGPDEQVMLNFQYQVLYDGGYDTESDDFRNTIGDVLSYIASISTAESPEDISAWEDFKLV